MSVAEPGTSWKNPIWYGRYRIYVGEPNLHPSLSYAFCHDDYDGAQDAHDPRAGHAKSVDDAKAAIDEIEESRTCQKQN